MSKRLNLEGQRFGRLIVLCDTGISKRKQSVWRCRCDCGKEIDVVAGDLKAVVGTKSCGCQKGNSIKAMHDASRTHGLSKTRIYSVYRAMRERCENEKIKCWERYGGRGIQVCSGLKTFENWLAVMGHRQNPTDQLDRINNDGHYSCGSCEECVAKGWPKNIHWTTRIKNMRNRRNTVLLTDANGVSKTIDEWAETLGTGREAITARIRRGMSDAEIIATPFAKYKPRARMFLTVDGITMGLEEWADKIGVSVTTIIRRRDAGMSDEEIVKTPLRQRRPVP